MSSQHHDSTDVSTAPKASEKRGKTRAKASSERTAALASKPKPALTPKATVAGMTKPKSKRKPGAAAEQHRRARQVASEYSAQMVARLPRRVQERRESIGLSMYALSMKCGVGRSTISELESGDRVPGQPVMFCLVKGLEWTLGEFYKDDMQG